MALVLRDPRSNQLFDMSVAPPDGLQIFFDKKMPFYVDGVKDAIGENKVDPIAASCLPGCGAEGVRMMRVRLLGNADTADDVVLLELTDPEHLFFQSVHEVTPESFPAIQQENGLRISFEQYGSLLLHLCEQLCSTETNPSVGQNG